MLNWFKKKKASPQSPLATDIHSHLLPGLDDGVKTFEEAEEIILAFKKLGYSKLITTPHVMSDHYKNTSQDILNKVAALKEFLQQKNITIEIEAAAEYYLDENLVKMLEANEPLLTFGNRYLLFETNFLSEPLNLKEVIFLLSTRGYRPVLAHPERYLYLQHDIEKMQDLLDRGVLFQINASSLTGHYSKATQGVCSRMIDRGWVHFIGSDCHHIQQVHTLESAQRSKYFQKALTLPLLNHSV